MEEQTLKNESMQLDSQENKQQSGEQPTKTYERKAIPNTPFIHHYSEDHGHALGIAEHRLTGWYEKESDMMKLITGRGKPHWDFMTSVILVLIDKTLEHRDLQNQINQKQQ